MNPTPPNSVLDAVSNNSVLVISHPGKWKGKEFHPSTTSSRKLDWCEGTGTVIGVKRNRVFILSALHCVLEGNYSFFVKGGITNQVQIPATLCVNEFVEENNGIDVAVFSCDSFYFDISFVVNLSHFKWDRSSTSSVKLNSHVWLVHFPTNANNDIECATHRLYNAVSPLVSEGLVLTSEVSNCTFDSTISATGGSSGGLIIDENGLILGVHDSEHDENDANEIVSTHRMLCELRQKLSHFRQLSGLFT